MIRTWKLRGSIQSNDAFYLKNHPIESIYGIRIPINLIHSYVFATNKTGQRGS